MVAIDTCTDTRPLSSTNGTICIVELDGGARHARQRVAENGAEEHVGSSGVYLLHGDAHLLHDVDAILEGKDDALLRGAGHVAAVVQVEVQATDGTARLTVLQHTLGTVTERQDADASTTYGHLGSQVVQFGV